MAVSETEPLQIEGKFFSPYLGIVTVQLLRDGAYDIHCFTDFCSAVARNTNEVVNFLLYWECGPIDQTDKVFISFERATWS